MSSKHLGAAAAVAMGAMLTSSLMVPPSQAQVAATPPPAAPAAPAAPRPESNFRQIQRAAPVAVTPTPAQNPAANIPATRSVPATSGVSQTPTPAPTPAPAPTGPRLMSESDTRALAKIQTEIGQVSQSLTSGAQVAVFPYRLNRIYQIDIKPGNFTTFMIPKNEPIRQFAVSNTEAAEIVVNEQANAAMLKLTAKISLSATIVTDKRAYFLTILPAQDSWHQGVSWTYDDGQGGSIASANASAGAMAAATAGTFGFRSSGTSNAFQEPVANTEEGLVGQPNFNYRFSGDTDITPIAVWDNGRFTWIQFPNQVQSLPAVFVMGPDGPEVVNYVVQPGGKQIKVNRLMPRFLLRLGSRKVTVEAQ